MEHLLPTPSAGNFNDGEGLASWEARRQRNLAKGINGNGQGTPLGIAVQMLPVQQVVDWGPYARAVLRWAQVLGTLPPHPVEPGRTGSGCLRRFVEWMQGLPAGWVTEVPGLSRNAQLKILGNGVVPQSAALAFAIMLPRAAVLSRSARITGMTDAIDHGRAVLGAILAGRPDLLSAAQRHLQPAHFTDSVQAALFSFCERYADQAGGVLPRAALADILRSQAPGTVLKYEEYYDLLTAGKPSDDEFRWSVRQLRELYADRRTGEVVTRSMKILTQGDLDGKRELRGHADARAFLLGELAGIERELDGASAPEGDMRAEGRDIKDDYSRREAQRAAGTAVSTGIPALDLMLGGGYQRGELGLVAGYTSSGKSKICAQTAWHAVTQQGRNVVIFTSETLRSQVRFSILARHSRLEKFGLKDGINTRDMKAGTLKDKNAFAAVLHDFASGGAYGRCYIAQVPRGATVATLESRLARLARDWTADLVIVDYLALLHPEIRHRDLRESLVEIIKEAKQVAATYQDGLGVPLLSPWQVRREARDEAFKRGGYVLSSLSETAEASNTPDVVLGLLEPDSDDSRGRAVPLKLSALKNRDGERGGEPIGLTADYATAYFAPAGSGTSHEDLIGYGESQF